METLSTHELAAMTKVSFIEYVNEAGSYTPRGNRGLYISLSGPVTAITGLVSNMGEQHVTRLVLVPLSSSKVSGLPKDISKSDMAVYMAFTGKTVDKSNRDALFRAAAIMSSADAFKFQEAVQGNPELVYTLLRQLNGGPMKRYDGELMDIDPGTHVDILANHKIDGKVQEDIRSNSFPADFNPNPLF